MHATTRAAAYSAAVPASTPVSVVVIASAGSRSLPRTVASALEQWVAVDEVVIAGSGLDDDDVAIARDVAGQDERLRLLDGPATAGIGEANLVRALAEVRGEIVLYLRDGDLWLPDHVEVMVDLLAEADLAHSLAICASGDDAVGTQLVDLADLADRARVVEGDDRIALSTIGHRLPAYRNLPYGWRTTPPDRSPAQHFVAQFLAEPWVRAASGDRPTAIELDHGDADAHERWAARLGDERWRANELPWLAFDAARASWRETERELRAVRASWSWRTGERWVRRYRRIERRLNRYR